MAEIRLAANLIEPLAFLGYNFGHLQIVLVDGNTQIGNEVQAPSPITIPFGGKWQYAVLLGNAKLPISALSPDSQDPALLLTVETVLPTLTMVDLAALRC